MSGCSLILGGGGFIGRHVALLLARAGRPVVLACRGGGASRGGLARCVFPAEVAGLVRWVPFEMGDVDWDGLLGGVETVYHFAWGTIPATANADPGADLAGNVGATVGLLEAVRRRAEKPRIVFASSGGTVYGRLQHVPVTEDHPLAPITAYGASKAAVELYLGYYRALHGLDCRVGRVANPYGAGQDITKGQGAATIFLNLALRGEPIRIWGDGEVVRDYIHIADAAAGLVALGDAPRTDGAWTFNIASGHGVSLNGIVAELEVQLGVALEVARGPGRGFDVPVSILDTTRARHVLGWSAGLSFSAGMGRTIGDLRRKADLSTMD